MQFCVLLLILLLLLLLLLLLTACFFFVILINNHFFSVLTHNITVMKTTQSNLCKTVTLGKWQGDRYIQVDRDVQVNFAENIRQLEIFWEVVR